MGGRQPLAALQIMSEMDIEEVVVTVHRQGAVHPER